jgi:protein-S-isoprenylcysteine O-methyltransferase Ste14
MNLCEITVFVGPCQYISYFWLGTLIGSVAAVIGAVVEYQRAEQRMTPRDKPAEARLPGCMIIMAGAMGGVGVVALVASSLAGSPVPALVMGLGVGFGFFGVFILLVLGWIGIERVRDRKREQKRHGRRPAITDVDQNEKNGG